MAIHELIQGPIAAQVSVRPLRLHEVFQTAANFVLIRTIAMRVAGTEKGQQRQAGDARLGVAARVSVTVTEHVHVDAGAVARRSQWPSPN